MATIDDVSAQMAEILETHNQILEAIASLPGAGGELTQNLKTNGFDIEGPPEDDDTGYAEPVRIISYGDLINSAAGMNWLNRPVFPQVLLVDPPDYLSEGDDGKAFAFAGADSMTVAFRTLVKTTQTDEEWAAIAGSDKKPPDPQNNGHWNVYLLNATNDYNITLDGGEELLNGSDAAITIAPGEGRWIIRLSNGYLVI